jgi:hypothetical protein
MLYGHDKTIHATKLVNVELDKDGKVVSVWFRCRALPFDQTVVDDDRAAEMRALYKQKIPELLAVDVNVDNQ